MEAALKAIAEPRRRAILQLVANEEKTAGQIADAFEVTRPAISQHLTVLKGAGLVSERRDGTRRYYKARREAIKQLQRFFDEFWTDKLSALKTVAEREERRRRGSK